MFNSTVHSPWSLFVWLDNWWIAIVESVVHLWPKETDCKFYYYGIRSRFIKMWVSPSVVLPFPLLCPLTHYSLGGGGHISMKGRIESPSCGDCPREMVSWEIFNVVIKKNPCLKLWIIRNGIRIRNKLWECVAGHVSIKSSLGNHSMTWMTADGCWDSGKRDYDGNNNGVLERS